MVRNGSYVWKLNIDVRSCYIHIVRIMSNIRKISKFLLTVNKTTTMPIKLNFSSSKNWLQISSSRPTITMWKPYVMWQMLQVFVCQEAYYIKSPSVLYDEKMLISNCILISRQYHENQIQSLAKVPQCNIYIYAVYPASAGHPPHRHLGDATTVFLGSNLPFIEGLYVLPCRAGHLWLFLIFYNEECHLCLFF